MIFLSKTTVNIKKIILKPLYFIAIMVTLILLVALTTTPSKKEIKNDKNTCYSVYDQKYNNFLYYVSDQFDNSGYINPNAIKCIKRLNDSISIIKLQIGSVYFMKNTPEEVINNIETSYNASLRNE